MTPIFMRIWLMKITEVWFSDRTGQFSEGLGHEAGLEPHVGVSHFAFNLRPGRQGGHTVDDHDVDGAASHQHVGDFQSLLAGIGLGDQQFVTVSTPSLRA
jgi:hypothetical protein